MVDEVRKIDPPVHVAAVVEDHTTQVAEDRDRIAQLGVQNEKLVSANGYWNQRALGRVSSLAERDIPDRAGFIGGKPSQGGTAAGGETLAGGHIAARKRSG